MTSIVEVVNIALDECKSRALVTSVFPPDGSLASNIANRQWWLRMDSLARSANWNSHKTQQTLSLLKAAQGTPENLSGSILPLPPQPWLYEYALPTQPLYLKARYIVPILNLSATSGVPMMTAGGAVNQNIAYTGRIPYSISSDLDANGNQIRVLLTNMQSPQLVYTCRVTDPTLWDPLFMTAAVGLLASHFAAPVGSSTATVAAVMAAAKDAIMTARISDGDENPMRSGHIPDWLTARGVQGWNSRDAYAAPSAFDSCGFGDGTII